MTEEVSKRLLKQIAYAVFTFMVYSLLVSWKVALLIMIGVSFHECGHIWAAHRMGLKTKGFYLFPFFGGAAVLDDKYKTYGQQAFVLLMGPAWGALLAFISAFIYYKTNSLSWAGAALWLAYMNMFNLFPLSFLDGGQLLDSITYSLHNRLGLILRTVSAVVAVPILFSFNPIIAGIVALVGLVTLTDEYKNYHHAMRGDHHLVSEEYKKKPKAQSKLQITVTLIIYAILLGSLMWLSAKMTEVNGKDLLHVFE